MPTDNQLNKPTNGSLKQQQEATKKELTKEAKVIDIDVLEIEDQDNDRKLDELIDTSFEEPTKEQKEYRQNVANRRSKDYKFYFSIIPKLPEWWDEFNTTMDDTGNRKYRNVFQFARAKGNNQRERDLIYEMIGPEPEQRKTLRVPWLGDWKRRRMAGYTSPCLPNNIKKLAIACRDKLESIQAIRSTGPYLVHELAMYSKMSEQINEAFNGRMFRDDIPPEDLRNLARAKAFIVLQKSITSKKEDLMLQWCKIHGYNENEPEAIMRLNQQINIGQMTGGIDTMSQKDLETVKLARMLRSHGENFNLPPLKLKAHYPEPDNVIDAEPVSNHEEKEHRTNGKGKVN